MKSTAGRAAKRGPTKRDEKGQIYFSTLKLI